MGSQEIGVHKQDWHSLETVDVIKQLDSQVSGLDEQEARRRLDTYGANQLTPPKKQNAWIRILTVSAFVLILVEIEKYIIRKYHPDIQE